MEWQPIETAPKDGSWILLTDGCNVEPAYWGDSYFNTDPAFIQYSHRSECVYPDLNTPYTGWAALPEPPKISHPHQLSHIGKDARMRFSTNHHKENA